MDFYVILWISQSHSNHFLFIFRTSTVTCYFPVYVDDLIITGNDNKFIAEFIRSLGIQFSLKDPKPLHLFLGIAVHSTTKGLFLSHHHYVRKLISSLHMDGVKPVSTPVVVSLSL